MRQIASRQCVPCLFMIGMFAACSAVYAQESATAEPALAGPKVSPTRKAPSLVQREFDGRLKRIEGEPVAAALDLLELDPAARAAADGVLAERAAELDALVRDNLKEIAELASARQAGDQARVRPLLRGLLAKAGPVLRKGAVVDQVAAVIPPDAGAELKRLVEEYAKAGLEDRMTSNTGEGMPRTRGGEPSRMRAEITERLNGFGTELRRAYERVFGERSREFQELIADLGLSPEQESRVQQIFTDLFQKTYGKPTRQQSTKAFFEAYALLDAEQRARLRERFAATGAGPKGP